MTILAVLKTAAISIVSRVRGAVMWLWLQIPFGNICTIRQDKQTITLTKGYMVIVSDGRSTDALPIYMVSQELVLKFASVMRAMGYPMPPEEAPASA